MKTPLLALPLFTACATNGPAPASEAPPAAIDLPAPTAAPAAPLPAAAPASDQDLGALIKGNAAFALDLYRYLSTSEEGNLFLSPASISAALAMTRAGARGATAEEMDTTLHFTLPQARLNPAFASLDQALTSHESIQLAVANRLWGQQGLGFEQEFLDLTRQHYGAELAPVDFAEPEPARVLINTWISEQTRERIPELIPRGVIGASTSLVLTNAIWFKGVWASSFDPANTVDAPFTRSDGSTVQTPLMVQQSSFRYGQDGDVQLLALPYQGEDVELLVALPAAHDGLPALEASLTSETLEGWDKALLSTPVTVWLPRFTTSADFELSEALADLGMPSAFSGGADFSGITTQTALAISAVLHQAWVQVNEEGTEAAAATAVVVKRSARPVPQVKVDRPFLLFIRDARAGTILFMGRVTDPTS